MLKLCAILMNKLVSKFLQINSGLKGLLTVSAKADMQMAQTIWRITLIRL